jgi:nitrogen fixation/metabolism regulation signal transduction histidine kinase
MRILRRRTLERRLFFWLVGLALIPALVMLGAAAWVGRGALGWFGTLGPWAEVAESGRALIDAAEPAAHTDSALASALEHHRAELTASLTQASRWSFLGARLVAMLPVALLLMALFLILAALIISRRLAHQLSRPIHELAEWTDLIAHEQPLPNPTPAEAGEVREVQALRQALRRASTELRAARDRALQQERLRAWGEMARRIAHEMKNPLTPLRLAAHRLSSAIQPGPVTSEPLRVIDEETARLEQLAREFSLLGRPSSGPRTDIDVAELMTSLTQSDVPADIRIEWLAGPALPHVLADYNSLQQALRNVLRNAVEAVSGRPDACLQIRIEAPAQNGHTVRLVVRDNGPGFPPAATERIFEPDYTTKPRGTGLGLAIARQTIQEHGGTILAAPIAGGGAQVEIVLPAQPERPA